MEDRTKRVAKVLIAAAAVPVLLWAYASGPDPGYSGVPNEHGGANCATAGCHGGTANSFTTGSVKVTFPSGQTYVPGVKQRLTVTVADSAATQRNWGFQMTARTASNTATMAGTLASADRFTLVLCGTGNPNDSGTILTSGGACASNRPFQYIEHNLEGSSRIITGGTDYQVDWTPPATAVGDVIIYVAGNAGNANGQADPGDHIYTARYTMTPAVAGPTPVITAVEHGASFAPGVVPNGFFQIKGTNLSSTTNFWDSFIVGGKLPTTVDNVSVTIGGKPAYIYVVTPGQINAIAPPDLGTGSMQVVVTNSGTSSAGFTTNSNSLAPAFFLWDGKYAVAVDNATARLAVKNSVFPGTTAAPAKPGDVLLLFGTGFGPTNPATPAGSVIPSTTVFNTTSPVTATVGAIPTTVFGSALTFAGLYQIAIQVPATAPDGDLPLVVSINGASSPVTTLLTVQK